LEAHVASAPSDPGPVLGRVDRAGRLISADPALADLQVSAGSRVGATLALPQIAAVARFAAKLGIPVSRAVIAAGADHDLDLWVRAEPAGEDVDLTIEGWVRRPAAGPRLAPIFSAEAEVEADEIADEWVADAELRLTAISPDLAHRLGTDQESAIGQPLTRLFQLVPNDGGDMPLIAALASRRDFSGQRAVAWQDDLAKVTLSGQVLKTESGDFAGFSGHLSFEVAQREVVAAKPEPLAVLDHSLDDALRTPLDRIIDAADKIVERTDGPLRSDYAAYASDIAAAGRHLLSVIRSMGETPVAQHDRIDLSAVTQEAVGLLQAAASDRRITIAVDAPAEPLMVRGEARGVIQILVNLIGNAVRHSPDGSRVWLSFTSGAQSSVTVADQGPGVALADQKRIFERFERVGEKPDGTGLGLAIARRLARSMGGDITLDSAPGEGARFTLSLPSA
jgi:signal transduction histidine kinase